MKPVTGKVIFKGMLVSLETRKAVQVLYNGSLYWIPKSTIDLNLDGTISIEHWVCKEKGLI